MKIVQISTELVYENVNLYALDDQGNIWLRRSGNVPNADQWVKIDPPKDQN